MLLTIIASLATGAESANVKASTKADKTIETTDSSDADLRAWIDAAADGDMAAFRRIYDRFLPQVRRLVGRLLGPRPEVDDLIQEVFVQVHGSLGDFRHDSKFGTWLYRVTRNVTISHLRKGKKTVDLADLQPIRAEARTLSKLEARDQVRALYTVLDQVSAEGREAFIMFEVEEMKLREIAELTDTSINTVAARVRRTRERLRTFLESSQSQEAP